MAYSNAANDSDKPIDPEAEKLERLKKEKKDLLKSVKKAYKDGYLGGVKRALEVADQIEVIDASAARNLRKQAQDIIKPPSLHPHYKEYVVKALTTVIDGANTAMDMIPTLIAQDVFPLDDKSFRKLVKPYDKWFGVLDDDLEDEPYKQLDFLQDSLLEIMEQAEKLRAQVKNNFYPVYDVSAALSAVFSPRYDNVLKLKSDLKVGHTRSRPGMGVYLDGDRQPLYRVKGKWIGMARGFKALHGSPSRPGKKQVAALVHEWVHALNNATGIDVNKMYGGQNGHVRTKKLSLKEPRDDFNTTMAIFNPSSWGAIIAGREFE